MNGNNDQYQYIEELLPRFCEGLTTEEESLLVEKWIAEDEANLKLVNQIHALHLAVDTRMIKRHSDIDKVLAKVKRRIHEQAVSRWEWIQRIAALLSIPLLLGCLWLYYEKDDVKQTIQMIEVKTNPGMTTSIVLPDSTLVCLNSESVLRYPSHFEEATRRVELEGEAFFDVTSNKEKRFVVSMGEQSQIEVYGTSFNVEAYAKDNKISTTLIEGTIGFIYKDKDGKAKKIGLKPHQKLVYELSSFRTQLYTTSGETETLWKDGKIIFNNTSMDEVLRMLSKRFNVEFVISNKNLKDYAFTGTFTQQRLERILEYFEISSQIKWRHLESDKIDEKRQKIEIY